MTWFARRSRRESEALLAYWDSVIAQSPARPVPPAPVPAALGALVRTLHTTDADAARPAYEDRLLEALLAKQKEIAPMNVTTTTPPILTPWRPPRLAAPRLPSVPVRKYAMPALEIALIAFLLLASVAGIWLASDRNDPHRIVAPEDGTPTVEATPSVPMFRGNPERTGQMPGPGPEGTPVELWRSKVEGPIDSAPAVVDGVLYVGVGDGTVRAFETVTGSEIWAFAAASPIKSSPAVVTGVVYIGSEDGTLYALDAASGAEVWTYPATRADAAVAVEDGIVYSGSGDGFLYALDAASGAELWRAPLNESATRSPAMADGVVYIASADGILHSFDAETGEPGWTFQVESDGTLATAVVAGGMVFQATVAGNEHHLYALDAATGEERWRFATPTGAALFSAAVGDGVVYTPSDDGNLYALDAATGDQLWQFTAGDLISTAPALVGDTVYVASHDGFAYAIDTVTGTEQWRFPIEGQADYGPVVVNGVAYIGTKFGYLYAIGGSGEPASGTGTGTSAIASTPQATPSTPVAMPVASPAATGELATYLWETASSGDSEELGWPGPVTVAPDGTIWLIDTEHSRFDLYTPDGTFLESWGTVGSGDGQFNFVMSSGAGDAYGAIAFAPDGSFYVADTGNQRIQHFSADRQFLRAWGEFGPGDGQFLKPLDIAVDSQGNVYVVEERREVIQKFDADGTYLRTFGGPDLFDFIGTMDIDANDHIWVADTGRVHQFNPDGEVIADYDGGGTLVQPAGVAVDDAGRIYVADIGAAQVIVLDASGALIGSWGQDGSGPGQLHFPGNVTLDGEGNVFVVDYLSDMTWEGRLVAYRRQPLLAP